MRDHPWRPRLTVAAVVLGTLLLTGCSGDAPEAPSESLPSTSSAAPTTEALPAVGPADFPVPPEARTKDAAGAEAMLRYWIDLIDYQRTIPAGDPLRALGPECQECQRIAQVLDEAAAAGNVFLGGDLTVKDVPAPAMGQGTAFISFSLSAEEERLLDSAGVDVAPPTPADPLLASGIDLLWSEAQQCWTVTNFGIG